jgi:hyperosmotically inducible periplasmic protein
MGGLDMNIKFKGLVLGAALSAFTLTACETTSNTNVNVNTKANGNTAVVVPDNNNTNVVSTTNANGGSTNANWNANITEADYEKDKDEYANRAKSAGDTIGQGAKDGWLWTKTKASLATTDDLRDSTINVDVNNNVVTLRGTVANAAQKTKAEQVAKAVQGVSSVKNELKVSAGDSMTNQMTGGSNTGSSNTKANANK